MGAPNKRPDATDTWEAFFQQVSHKEATEGLTSQELRERLKISDDKLRGILRKGVASGRIIVVHGPRTNIIGVTRDVPLYKIQECTDGRR